MSSLPWERHYRRGVRAVKGGQPALAVQEFQKALARATSSSDVAAVCNDLGTIHAQMGDHEAAIQHLLRAAELHPENGRIWINLAVCQAKAGKWEGAADSARRGAACSLEPEATWRALRFLQRAGLYSDAVEGYLREIERNGATPGIWNELGTALCASGRTEEGERAYLRSLELDPDFAPAGSNRLFALHLADPLPPEIIADEHIAWGRRMAARIQPGFSFTERNGSTGRPLRVGILSSDLRAHSIVYFLAPILENLSPRKFPITVFSNVASPDQTTERLKEGAQRWLTIDKLTPRETAEAIYRESIDVLVEVGGHTSPKTLETLAWKPAPIQIAYLAYPDTTGLKTVDYVLTDAVADPPGSSEHLYSERLLRLSPCGLCYRPPEATPAYRQRGEAAPVVFGSFAQRQKLSPRTLCLWASILRRLPDSRLLCKAKAWADPRLCAELREWFAAQGVGPERIDLLGHVRSTRDHLDLYQDVDIGLDTYPYSGITTTCEALWMGVPVIALPGRNQVSRLCASILEAAGLPELVATGDPDYVERALRLASDVLRLRRERPALRQRLRASPLFDEQGFARQLEAALRAIWRDHVASL
jgi:protein O-GlcNAc transferase